MNLFALIIFSWTLAVSALSFKVKGAGLLSRKDLCHGRKVTCLMSTQNFPPLDASTKEMIERLVISSRVVLFMKGTKAFPQW